MATEKRLNYQEEKKRLAERLKQYHDLHFTPGVYEHSIFGMAAKLLEVDAVEVDDMKAFAKDVAYQFGCYCQYEGRLHITHGGLSTLEEAFEILGWDNTHPAPEFECEIDGCHEHATCGAPTSDGYKRMCGKHFAERRTNV